MIAGTLGGAAIPAALAAQYNFNESSKPRPNVSFTENDNYPAYNGNSPVETAIRALSAQRPSEGLTENDNYSAGEGISPVNQGISFETDPITGQNTNSANLSNAPTGFGNVPQRQVGAFQTFTAPDGTDLSGSTNFNQGALRWSTDKAPIVQAAKKAVQQTAPAASSSQSNGIANLLSSLFQNKGGEYQSTGERLYRGDMPEKGMGPVRPTGVNFGDPDRASDFFRASKALQGLQGDQAPAEKRGGRIGKTNEHSAILHKALEIIHHMALKNH
jgi:hypothetical protein